MITKEASLLLLAKIAQALANLKCFALKYKSLPALSYTHLQPAQLTTIGKRATLWMNELILDMQNLQYQIDHLMPLGCKGTTGTQASFADLFDGDYRKAKALDESIVRDMGFQKAVPVSGQRYTRKEDAYLLRSLAGIGESANKFAQDIRMLQSFREVEEPFESAQVGSSAMPYKRNPMRCERISALSRYLILNSVNSDFNASSQFLERTLDDSANRRLTISECFLTADAILNLYINVTDGLVVNKKVIAHRVQENLPFMASANIMMEAVKKGGDRQILHERLRVYSQKAATETKQGKTKRLLVWIEKDPLFPLTQEEINHLVDAKKFTGFAAEQTFLFIRKEVDPLLRKYHQKTIKETLSV